MTAAHEIGNLLAHRFDQAANSLAMTDLRAKPEISCGGLDFERASCGRWLAAVNLEVYRVARCSRGRRDVVGGDFFRMCNEITELLPTF